MVFWTLSSSIFFLNNKLYCYKTSKTFYKTRHYLSIFSKMNTHKKLKKVVFTDWSLKRLSSFIAQKLAKRGNTKVRHLFFVRSLSAIWSKIRKNSLPHFSLCSWKTIDIANLFEFSLIYNKTLFVFDSRRSLQKKSDGCLTFGLYFFLVRNLSALCPQFWFFS